jgi:hypothetical protein
MYSSFDTICAGTGEPNEDVSAGNNCASSSGLSMMVPPVVDTPKSAPCGLPPLRSASGYGNGALIILTVAVGAVKPRICLRGSAPPAAFDGHISIKEL